MAKEFARFFRTDIASSSTSFGVGDSLTSLSKIPKTPPLSTPHAVSANCERLEGYAPTPATINAHSHLMDELPP